MRLPGAPELGLRAGPAAALLAADAVAGRLGGGLGGRGGEGRNGCGGGGGYSGGSGWPGYYRPCALASRRYIKVRGHEVLIYHPRPREGQPRPQA